MDVPAGEWYADSVAWAVEKNITNGTSTNTFSPYQNCSHVQILTFLWRAAGEPKSSAMGVVRSTFIIDENGVIEKVMPKVKPDTNAAEILAYLKGDK